MFGVAAQVATALRRLNATGRTPITPVPAHKLNVFGKAVESGCLFFGDTMVERHALSAQARSSPCDGHRPGGSPACSGLPLWAREERAIAARVPTRWCGTYSRSPTPAFVPTTTQALVGLVLVGLRLFAARA